MKESDDSDQSQELRISQITDPMRKFLLPLCLEGSELVAGLNGLSTASLMTEDRERVRQFLAAYSEFPEVTLQGILTGDFIPPAIIRLNQFIIEANFSLIDGGVPAIIPLAVTAGVSVAIAFDGARRVRRRIMRGPDKPV